MSLPAKRFRIGVDFHVWDGIFQGSRSHLLGMYAAAIQLAPEFDFVFFLGDVDGLRTNHPEFGATHVQLVQMPHCNGLLRLGLLLPYLQWRHRIDLMHYQYRLPPYKPGACACTIHDVLFETHPQFFSRNFVRQSRWTSRTAVREANLLFTVSRYTQTELVRLYGVDPKRIAVTFNAVDHQLFRPAVDDSVILAKLNLQRQSYILTVGRLEPRKNQLGLLEAYAGLGAHAPLLLIVGQRDFRFQPLLDAIDALGLGSRVRLLENVSDAELPVVFRNALLFAYPAFAEGFGMPVLEALACGVPVITSNTTSMPEVAGEAALLVDPHSTVALTTALRRLVDDAALRARLSAAGVAQAALYSWQASAAVLIETMRRHFAVVDPS